MKKASLDAGQGATYVRDVVVRGGGKVDIIEKIVRSINPKYTDWVLRGVGTPPTPASFGVVSSTPRLASPLPETVQVRTARLANLEPNLMFDRDSLVAIVEGVLAGALPQHASDAPAIAEVVAGYAERVPSHSQDAGTLDTLRILSRGVVEEFFRSISQE